MGYDPGAVTLVLNRADTNVGITPGGRRAAARPQARCARASDRAIPRAITDGQPISEAEPSSKAARAFAALAEHYVRVAGGRGRPGSGRQRAAARLRRKGGNDGAPRADRTLQQAGAPVEVNGNRRRRDRPVRGGEEPDPPRACQRARAAALRRRGRRRGPRAGRGRDPRRSSSRRRGSRARTGCGSPPRSRTTSSATARSSGSCPTPRSRRSWSTAPRDLDRAPRPALAHRRYVHRRVAPAADHHEDGRPGRPAYRRVVADGRRAPARRLARERDHRRRSRSRGRC